MHFPSANANQKDPSECHPQFSAWFYAAISFTCNWGLDLKTMMVGQNAQKGINKRLSS